MNAQPMSFGRRRSLNWLFAYMGGNLLTVHSLTHTHSNDDIFHDFDKMLKHVQMVRQNANKKIGTDKMPTTIKSQTKCQPLVGILSGWYFVLPPLYRLNSYQLHSLSTTLASYVPGEVQANAFVGRRLV